MKTLREKNRPRLFLYFLLTFIYFSCGSPSVQEKKLTIVSGSEWGSIPLEHNSREHSIEYITIHHGGIVYTGEKTASQYLIDLQAWSRSEKQWVDIPYHYVMDLEGIIYETRSAKYPGDTNTEYDPTGHLLICILGNYEQQELNVAQFDNLVLFLAEMSQKHDIPLFRIKCHKDYTRTGETACPGKNIYRFLDDGSLLAKVKKLVKKDVIGLNK